MTLSIDESSVFQPPARPAADAPAREWPVQRVRAVDADAVVTQGKLGSAGAQIAYTLATDPTGAPGRPLIVHCGGNAADRYRGGPGYAAKAIPFGDVMLFDYPGYGDSDGARPTAASLEAARAILAPFIEKTAAGRPVILWGHSLGGFVCASMLVDLPSARGIIFETTARNVAEVSREWTPWYARPFVRVSIAPSLAAYDNAKAVLARRTPALVLAAGRDTQLPPVLARSLAAAITAEGGQATLIEFPTATHNSVPDEPGLAPAVRTFLARALTASNGG
jgi:pimeloyl-ACP methyl ester carboxylesterase